MLDSLRRALNPARQVMQGIPNEIHVRYTAFHATQHEDRSSSMLAMMRSSPKWYFENAPRAEPLRASPMLRGSPSAARDALHKPATGIECPERRMPDVSS